MEYYPEDLNNSAELGKIIGVQPNRDVWAFDYMTNNWQQLSMVPDNNTSSKHITYDIESESNLITADGSIWSYDFDEDTWTSMYLLVL